MKKLTILLVFCFSINISSQTNDIYKIEELSEPNRLLTTTTLSYEYSKILNIDIIKTSTDEELIYEGTHPLLGGFLKAYKEHRPITISPDIMWLLICQGFAQHVNNNAEELRSKFVDFKGQKELVVQRQVEEGTNMADFPWESVFPEFVEKIGDNTSEKLTENLAANFTTTTPTSLIASQITIMESVKVYFKYKGTMMIGCGIPEVKIEGTVEDWQKILTKINYIAQYDLEWWTSELTPVIQKIIDTKSGKEFDENFWMDIVRFHREGLYGSKEDIDGWLVKFFPYSSSGKKMDLKKIRNIENVPKEIVRVPFIFDISDEQGVRESYKMEFWAGFLGLEQDSETYNLKPKIGWAINKTVE